MQRWSKVGYPNGMERQAIAIRFSLPVASANSLHSLFKACASLAYNTKHYEIIAYYTNHLRIQLRKSFYRNAKVASVQRHYY